MQHENIASWHIQVLQFALETLESNIICTIEQSHGEQGCPFVQNKSAAQTNKQRKGIFSALQGYSNKHKQKEGMMMVSLQQTQTQTQGNAWSAPAFAMADCNNSCYWEKV